MAESAQPAIKNMAIVKNKNNVTEMTLAKQIEEYKREQSMVLLSIDQDRLDMKDFLRQIRICESDDLPEARHWLGQRRQRENSDLRTINDVVKLPPLSARNTTGSGNERTAQTEQEEETDRDLTSSGTFRTKRINETSQKVTLYNIYSRRAELVDAGPTWGTQVDQEDKSVVATEKQDDKGEKGLPEIGISEGAQTTTRQNKDEQTNPGTDEAIRHEKCDIDYQNNDSPATPDKDVKVGKSSGATVKECHHDKSSGTTVKGRHPDKETRRKHRHTADGDFMKELLVSNAKKRYKKKVKPPIQERLIEFYSKLEQLKERDAADVPTAKHIRRRYVLLTQGVKAALAISSDEDEDIDKS